MSRVISFWILVLLAASAGALFGAAGLSWPWRRPHPVRGTISFGLMVASFIVLVGSHLLGFNSGPLAKDPIFTGVGVVFVIAVWVAPGRPRWERLIMTLAWGWLAIMYAQSATL